MSRKLDRSEPGLYLSEIAERLGMSRQSVWRLYDSALKKMREFDPDRGQELLAYFEERNHKLLEEEMRQERA